MALLGQNGRCVRLQTRRIQNLFFCEMIREAWKVQSSVENHSFPVRSCGPGKHSGEQRLP